MNQPFAVNKWSFRIGYSNRFFFMIVMIFSLIVTNCVFSDSKNVIPVTWEKLEDHLYWVRLTTQSTRQSEIELIIVKLDDGSWQFSPYHFTQNNPQDRLTARQWLEHTNSKIVINAGQYDNNFNHLGWLLKDGKNLGARLHPIWKGLLACNPENPHKNPQISIIDTLSFEANLKTFPYKNAIQSMMLFDKTGKIRINKSTKKARRTIVATGKDHNLYIIVTVNKVTLWDLASILKTHPIDFAEAISMDGGRQSQIAIQTENLNLDFPTLQMPLPATICFKQR